MFKSCDRSAQYFDKSIKYQGTFVLGKTVLLHFFKVKYHISSSLYTLINITSRNVKIWLDIVYLLYYWYILGISINIFTYFLLLILRMSEPNFSHPWEEINLYFPILEKKWLHLFPTLRRSKSLFSLSWEEVRQIFSLPWE